MKTKTILAIAAASAAIGMVPNAANATIFTYNMTNGDVLTINSDTKSGSMVGQNINANFTSAGFADFNGAGGTTPSFKYVLDTLSGKRLIKGQWVEPNPLNKDTTHPQVLKGLGDGRVNLWAWWGDPIIGGDYVPTIDNYSSTSVPAPGMLGLMGLALAGLFFGRRRKVKLSFDKNSGLAPVAA